MRATAWLDVVKICMLSGLQSRRSQRLVSLHTKEMYCFPEASSPNARAAICKTGGQRQLPIVAAEFDAFKSARITYCATL